MVQQQKQIKGTTNPVKIAKTGLSGDFKIQALLLIVVGFIFYSNSFTNEYALDDGIVIQKNEYVQQGFRGIPKIFKTDSYDSFYRQMNAKQQLSGGRYRPLSVVTFAIEQSLFGSKEKNKPDTDVAMVRHILNVLFYILSVVVLLFFLNTFIFQDKQYLGFFVSLLFLIHPIHTEVISNVKSRDEILSFLFIILTFIAVFRYRETKKISQIVYGSFFYFLALLSKEYAITLLILIPMLMYIIKRDTFKDSFFTAIPYFFVAGIYLIVRFNIVGKGGNIENPDVLNAPFKFATAPERWATKIEILNHYLKLLFFPHPLSSDYSYAAIAYRNFSNGTVWLSVFIHLLMIATTIILFIKRNILSFALAFYLLHLLLISNLLMDIGATMGERLVYHSSFGFVIVMVVLLNKLFEKISIPFVKRTLVISLALIVTVCFAGIVIPRNAQWKNDASLFIADAETVPNSALVNGNAGKAYLDLSEKKENKEHENELIKKSIYHLKRAVSIHNEYVNGYLNLGVAYYKLKEYDSAKVQWDAVNRIYPNNPFLKRNYGLLANIYFVKAMKIGAKQPQEAIRLLEYCVQEDPQNEEYWYNLGGACFTNKDYEKARNAWAITLQINPNNEHAKQGMAALPPVSNK